MNRIYTELLDKGTAVIPGSYMDQKLNGYTDYWPFSYEKPMSECVHEKLVKVYRSTAVEWKCVDCGAILQDWERAFLRYDA